MVDRWYMRYNDSDGYELILERVPLWAEVLDTLINEKFRSIRKFPALWIRLDAKAPNAGVPVSDLPMTEEDIMAIDPDFVHWINAGKDGA